MLRSGRGLPKGRGLLRPDAPIPRGSSVFLNIPYDDNFVDLYLAYIAGMAAFGLVPRSAIEIPGGKLRLDRIFALIQLCHGSLHDLSRVEARFNMPFELGLAVAWCDLNESGHIVPKSDHTWFVFASDRGIEKAFSDLLGSDSYIHDGSPQGLFRELCNAFVRSYRRPRVRQMERIFRALRRDLPQIMLDAGAKSAFTTRVFDDLRLAAGDLTDRYVVQPE